MKVVLDWKRKSVREILNSNHQMEEAGVYCWVYTTAEKDRIIYIGEATAGIRQRLDKHHEHFKKGERTYFKINSDQDIIRQLVKLIFNGENNLNEKVIYVPGLGMQSEPGHSELFFERLDYIWAKTEPELTKLVESVLQTKLKDFYSKEFGVVDVDFRIPKTNSYFLGKQEKKLADLVGVEITNIGPIEDLLPEKIEFGE